MLACRFALIQVLFFSVLTMAHADEIIVGGILTEDRTWTPDNTYIIVQDFRIGTGVTLTILPGVTVKIDQGRGLQVWGGSLVIGDESSVESDSVYFKGNYRGNVKSWKWKGIIVQGATDESIVILNKASIRDAEIGLQLVQSYRVVIKNSTLAQNQNIGVQLIDCNQCVVESCLIVDNYTGIGMTASPNFVSSRNSIMNNRIINTNHNIYMSKESEGVMQYNTIAFNLIQGGNNGIWMDNAEVGSSSQNVVSDNIFVSNGAGFGFGILVAFDSTQITNNIFWLNNMALTFDPQSKSGFAQNNSFYQNIVAVQVREGCIGNNISLNTLSDQIQSDFETKESTGIVFKWNNLFPRQFELPVAYNIGIEDITIDSIYWGTSENATIENLIWDRHDDPDVGTLYFQPFLIKADTSLPISPPKGVKKQLVNGQVKVSWSKNPEEDLAGYKLYYGDFQYYSFDNSLDVGSSESSILTDNYFFDSIAVTAYDSLIGIKNTQLSGNESPFAFAAYYPYAGEESEICSNQSSFALLNSSAPFSYSELIWLTSGDGYFDDKYLLNPTYFPGTADKLQGSVFLSLNVLKDGNWVVDSLTLNIQDNVVVSAGNDTTIFNDEQFSLGQAFEENTSYIKWTSAGDGSFVNDTLINTVYVLGADDIEMGFVMLRIFGQNTCSSALDSIRLTILSRFTLQGTVWQGSQRSGGCAVLAFDQTLPNITARSIVTTQNDGAFTFSTLTPSNYLLYAIPDTIALIDYYPGYYADVEKWQEAYPLSLNADIYDVDIHLPAYQYLLPQGVGRISGTFLPGVLSPESEEIYCQPWFGVKSAASVCQDGQSNITILLYTSGGEKTLKYTLTNENGNFYFENLPMGEYIIGAQKAGYTSMLSPLITLTMESPEVDNVQLSSEHKTIEIFLSQHDSKSLIRVYPNPATNRVTLSLKNVSGDYYTLAVYDVYGRKYTTQKVNTATLAGNEGFSFDVSAFPTGLYFGTLSGFSYVECFSFVVR